VSSGGLGVFPGAANGFPDGALDRRLVEMVAIAFLGTRSAVPARGEQDELPGPLASGVGQLAGEGVGQVDVAGPLSAAVSVVDCR
jgi:hypothetical protein